MRDIIVGYIDSPEGAAAVRTAVQEARLRQHRLVVIHSSPGGAREDAEDAAATREKLQALRREVEAEGVVVEVQEMVRGKEPYEDVVNTADERDAALIVIGMRRRSPVGKLLLGSNAQQILLNANCPVLAVKADT